MPRPLYYVKSVVPLKIHIYTQPCGEHLANFGAVSALDPVKIINLIISQMMQNNL